MDGSEYLGISEKTVAEYKESGSKFYGYLVPVTSEQHALITLSNFKEEFKDATHVCHGMVVGVEREIQRFSDDGEPNNSAGRPILNNLLSANITFVLGIVVRYYGGKKLGIPGLIRAYGAAIHECIEKAKISSKIIEDKLVCKISMVNQHLLFNFLNSRNDLRYSYINDQFNVWCSQSVTPTLRSELSKIPTLVLE